MSLSLRLLSSKDVNLKLSEATTMKMVWEMGVLGKSYTENKSNTEGTKKKKLMVI